MPVSGGTYFDPQAEQTFLGSLISAQVSNLLFAVLDFAQRVKKGELKSKRSSLIKRVVAISIKNL